MTEKINSVFFGIMVGDLFADEDVDTIDERASVSKYAEMVTEKIKAVYGNDVEVDWNSQNAGGSIPFGLQTQVNGERIDDYVMGHAVEAVDTLIGDVWQSWDWVVYK